MKEGRDGACWAWHGVNVDGGLVNTTDDADVGLLTGWREVGVALDEVVAWKARAWRCIWIVVKERCAASKCSGFYEGGVSEVCGWGWYFWSWKWGTAKGKGYEKHVVQEGSGFCGVTCLCMEVSGVGGDVWCAVGVYVSSAL